ncbi:MAG: TraB/GumN family protein [Opitutales bacterium]|nr:TraB/GumN family protein [Opitutales bacterium]
MKTANFLTTILALGFLGQSFLSAEPEDRGMVWKVESPTASVYLAGSVHILSFDDYPLPPPYESAYEASGKVVFELNMGDLFSLEKQTILQQSSRLPQGTTLEDVLRPDTLNSLEKYLQSREFSRSGFAGHQPWFVATTITTMELMHLGLSPMAGVDMHFYQRAIRDGKSTGALETLEYQLSLFSDLSMEEQDRFLQASLIEIDTINQELQTMLTYWRTGQADQLANFLNEGLAEFPTLKDSLLDERNRNWVAEIETFLAGEETVMVVVGAGHLVGENSVVELLEKNGHTPVRWE